MKPVVLEVIVVTRSKIARAERKGGTVVLSNNEKVISD
jgi:hypothetical protein